MKRKISIFCPLIIITLTISLISLFGCSSKDESKETAQKFLEGTFTVEDYSNVDKLKTIPLDKKITSNGNEAIETLTQESNGKISEISYGKAAEFMTNNLKDNGTLIMNRTNRLMYEFKAKDGNYYTSIKELDITEAKDSNDSKKRYNYTINLEDKYNDNTVKERELNGYVYLAKENDKWLVDYLIVNPRIIK